MNFFYRKNKGFTILELMIGVAVIGVIGAAAYPSLNQFVQNQEMKSQASGIADAMSSARAIALSRASDTEVCWNSTNATKALGDSNVDVPPNEMVIVDTDVASDSIGKRFQYIADGFVLDDNSEDSCVIFDAQGRANTTPNFLICRAEGDDTRALTVSVLSTGRASVVEGNPNEVDDDEDDEGLLARALSCG